MWTALIQTFGIQLFRINASRKKSQSQTICTYQHSLSCSSAVSVQVDTHIRNCLGCSHSHAHSSRCWCCTHQCLWCNNKEHDTCGSFSFSPSKYLIQPMKANRYKHTLVIPKCLSATSTSCHMTGTLAQQEKCHHFKDRCSYINFKLSSSADFRIQGWALNV